MAQKGCTTQTRGQGSRESQPHFRHILTHTRFSRHLLGEMHMYAQAKLSYLNVYAATHLGRTPRHTCARTHTRPRTHAWATKLAKFVLHTRGCAWSRWECERERLCTHNAPPL